MLNTALSHWNSLHSYRAERLRCKNYTYGRQYLDTITYQNRRMTEEEYILSEGNVPLKNNLIRRIVRNVLGVFRNNMHFPAPTSLGLSETDPEDMIMIQRLQTIIRDENLKELYSRLMEEYLIGGMVAVKKRIVKGGQGLEWLSGEEQPEVRVITEPVRADSFFFNLDATDPRGRDIAAIGEIHDLPLDTAVAAFASSGEDAAQLRALAGYGSDINGSAATSPRVRIVEFWRLEHRPYWICHDKEAGSVYASAGHDGAEDPDAVRYTQPVWRYYFIGGDGRILRRGDSPFPDAGHPYVMKAYPFIDGEIHSFVADCIDQQRYINRLITLNDWILRASAKGVLLMPDGSLPDGVEMSDITDQWSRFNGVISYRPQEGVPAPHQVSNNSSNSGISELLSVQLKMMEDVSGVNAALQGQLTSGAVSGTLFEMQTRQALTGLADIIEGFESFMRDCAMKDIKMLRPLGLRVCSSRR